MRPKCGPNAARKWPEFEIFWPKINPSKFTVTRARPVPKLQARNPTRTMKKVARPSPTKKGFVRNADTTNIGHTTYLDT